MSARGFCNNEPLAQVICICVQLCLNEYHLIRRRELKIKRILSWLEAKSSQTNPSISPDQPSAPKNVEPDGAVRYEDKAEISFDPDLPGRIESQGEGKSILMPDVYDDPNTTTVPDLKILDHSLADIDEPAGFNPYDTATLQKKS